jgi:hypothetical protein
MTLDFKLSPTLTLRAGFNHSGLPFDATQTLIAGARATRPTISDGLPESRRYRIGHVTLLG